MNDVLDQKMGIIISVRIASHSVVETLTYSMKQYSHLVYVSSEIMDSYKNFIHQNRVRKLMLSKKPLNQTLNQI